METTAISNGAPTTVPTSQTAEIATNVPTAQTAPKLRVEMDESGRIKGPNSPQFATLTGLLVRAHCPVSFLDWRIVPRRLKEDIWNKLMQQYEFNVPSHLAKKFVMKTFPQKLRSFKYELRRGPLKGKVTMAEKIAACPMDYSLDHWKTFVKHESDPDIKKKHAKCGSNHKKKSIKHTLGRLSYANKCYNLAQKEGGFENVRRGVSWMEGHVGKDGKVHPSAVEAYEKVKAATEKRKRLIDEGLVDPMDIDNDEITEVFGPDKGKSGLLGYSSHTSKAQTLHANLATSVMASKGARMDEIELERTTQRITKIVLQALRDQQKNQHPQAMGEQPENQPAATGDQHHNQHHQAMGEQQRDEHATNNQPIPDVQRTTIPIPNHGSNIGLVGVENPLDGVQFVHLFNRKRLTVATGYVVYGEDGERCHTVQVLADERKIRLKSIYDGDCQLPDAPQGDDRNHLWEYSPNECLIWPVSRMEFMNE